MGKIEMTHEQSLRLSQQLMRAVKTEATITCFGAFPMEDARVLNILECRTVPLWKAYRCFYCGFFMCPECAPRHFENANMRETAAPPEESK